MEGPNGERDILVLIMHGPQGLTYMSPHALAGSRKGLEFRQAPLFPG